MGLTTGSDDTLLRALQHGFDKAGKKLDMGKSCIRFKKANELALEVIGATVKRLPAADYIRRYEASLGTGQQPKTTAKAKAKAKPKPKPKPKPTAQSAKGPARTTQTPARKRAR